MSDNKKFIHHIDWDETYGIPIATDMYGYRHIIDWEIMTPDPYHRIFLNGYRTTNFPNTSNFHPINNIITGELFLRYTVPEDHDFFLGIVHIAQSREGLSLLGIYINNELITSVPFYHEVHFTLCEPMKIISNSVLEFKARVHNNNTDIGVMSRGILIDKAP